MPPQDDPRISLNTAYFNVVHALHAALPPSTLASPLALRRRMDSAIAMVASLVPVNVAEAMLAANWVGTTMQAMDCQAMAHEPGLAWERKVKCLALANSAQRAAKGLLEQFRQVQAMRIKREGLVPSPDQAAWIEHQVGATMEAVFGTLRAESDQDMGQSPMDRVHETTSGVAEPAPGPYVDVGSGPTDQNPEQMVTARHSETNPRDTPPPCAPDQIGPVPGGSERAQRTHDGMPGVIGVVAAESRPSPGAPAIRPTISCDGMAEPGSSGAWNPLPSSPPLGIPTGSPRACLSCADERN